MAWDSRAAAHGDDLPAAGLFVIVLLFPFYWMTITAFKPNDELYDYKDVQPVLDRSRRPWTTSSSCCSRPTIRAG